MIDDDTGRISDGKTGRPMQVSLVQAMIVLNGMLLTVAACFVVWGFTQEIAHDSYQSLATEAQQMVVRNIGEMEHGMEEAALSLKSIPIGSIDKSDFTHFDRVFLVHADLHQTTWETENIYMSSSHYGGNMREILSRSSESDFMSEVRSALNNHHAHGKILVLSHAIGINPIMDKDVSGITTTPLVLATLLNKPDGTNAMLIGIARPDALFDPAWLAKRAEIETIVFRDSKSERPIFDLGKKKKSGGLFHSKPYAFSGIAVPMMGQTMNLALSITKNQRMEVITAMPLAVLFLGSSLTLIALFYVRSSQSHAYRLKDINRELSRKNLALKNEMIEREKLFQSLRKSERENRSVLDSVGDIIFETSTDGDILLLNQAWSKVTGFDIEQALGRNLFDMLHPQDQEDQRTQFSQLVKGQRQAYRAYTRIRTSAGTFRAVELAMSMMRQDENGKLRVVGSFTDVEERRRAERALTEAEKKYRTIVDNAAGGIYQLTPEGQYLSANLAMARILQYDNPEQILRSVRNANEQVYVNPKDRSKFIRELETLGAVKDFETQVFTKTGEKIWVNENARAVQDDEGNVLYYEGSIVNITQRKEGEIKLRDAKIQSDLANRAKSEFLANMSHELRTPLNAIIGFSEIIKNEIFGQIPQRQYWEYARDIHDSGRKLLTIINEILDISRIEAGNRQLNEGVVSIPKLVASCVDIMIPKAQGNQMTISNLIDSSVPQLIGEELAIKQVLLNLMSNAIKFTPSGGRMTLSYEVDGDGQLRLSVTDTGIGLDEAGIEKALSPFGQVETAFNRSISGAGLGLTLVDSLMKLHNGRLELFSQKGIGTTATIVFPARRVAHDAGYAPYASSDGDANAADSINRDWQ